MQSDHSLSLTVWPLIICDSLTLIISDSLTLIISDSLTLIISEHAVWPLIKYPISR